MRWKLRRFSRKHLFAVLMAASLILLFVPGRFVRFAKNPLQLLAAMQWAVHDKATAVEDGVRAHVRPAVSGEEFEQLRRVRESLENRLATTEARLAETQEALGVVTGWRGRGLPASVRLIRSRVCSLDAVAWHESLSIDRGSSDGVQTGDWVVSHGFVPTGADGKAAFADLLLSECLLGQVAETAPFTSRVILLTDAYLRPPTRARVARLEDGKVSGADKDLVLYGVGQGLMSVPDVPASLFDAGKVRVGDLIISCHGDPRLPIPMVIGQIDRIDRDAKNPLLYRLTVKPRLDARSVRQVYVVSASGKED